MTTDDQGHGVARAASPPQPCSPSPPTLRVAQVSVLLVFYVSLALPYQVAFLMDYMDSGLSIMDFFIDCFFLADIVVNFRTAILHDGELVSNPYAVAREYMRLWFWLDLISSIPFDWFLGGLDLTTTECAGAEFTPLAPSHRSLLHTARSFTHLAPSHTSLLYTPRSTTHLPPPHPSHLHTRRTFSTPLSSHLIHRYIGVEFATNATTGERMRLELDEGRSSDTVRLAGFVRVFKVVKLLRLLRVVRLFRYVSRWEGERSF